MRVGGTGGSRPPGSSGAAAPGGSCCRTGEHLRGDATRGQQSQLETGRMEECLLSSLLIGQVEVRFTSASIMFGLHHLRFRL